MQPALRYLCLLWLLTGWCWAQKGPAPDPSVRFLYPIGKIYKNDTVVPLIVELSNTTAKNKTFSIKWSLDIPVPAELANARLKPGDKRRFPLFFPRHTVAQLYNFDIDEQSYSLDLQTNSRTAIAAILSPTEEKFDYLRSLKLEVDVNALNTAAQANNNGQPAAPPKTPWITLANLSNLEPELFPESWAPLASLDTIIVYDLPALSLSQRQKQALMAWCCRGGRLVLVSDGSPTEYQGTPFEPYLPLKPSEVVTEGGLNLLVGPLASGAQTLATHQDKPLLVGRPALDGQLYLITAPLKQLAPLSAAQAEKLWRQVLPPAPDPNVPTNYNSYNPNYSSYGIAGPASNTLRDIPELPRARAGWLALYLLTYALIVGPINLGFLRRRDKMLWSFVTVPAIALAFAGGAYLLNLANRSSQPLLRELGVVRVESGEALGHATSEALFFSPSARDYQLDCDPMAICHSGTYSYGDKAFGLYSLLPDGGLQGSLRLSTWDIYTLGTESLRKLPGPITGTWKDNVLTVNSSMESSPGEALLYHRSKGVSSTFTLKSGAQVHQLPLTSNSTYNVFNPISSQAKEHPGRDELLVTLSNAATQSFKEEPVYLLFWTDKLQVPIAIGDDTTHKSEYLVIVELES